MKNILIILLTLFSLTAKGQNNQSIELRFPYHKSEVFQWRDFDIQGQYFFGKDYLQGGFFLTADASFDDYIFGVNLRTILLSVGNQVNIYFESGVGVLADSQNEDAWGNDHHPNYYYYGATFQYEVSNKFTVHQYIENRYWDENKTFVVGLGFGYRIR